MKRNLFSLVLAAVMLIGIVPFTAMADSGIIVQETFESQSNIEKATTTNFGGENATITCALRQLKMVKGKGTGVNDKSMKMAEKTQTIALKTAPTENYTVEFDVYGTGAIAGSNNTELRFMVMKDISKRPISLNATTQKWQTNAGDLDLAYVPGHWYHAKVEFTVADSKTTQWKTTITDLATGESANKTITVTGAGLNSNMDFIAVLGDTNDAMYMDNFEVYTGTAGGKLPRAALIPATTAYTVNASATAAEGSVAVSGGANKDNRYFKTGDVAKVTATAQEGYTFTGWTATGVELTAEQQTANPLNLTVASADVTLTANFSSGSTAPSAETTIAPTTANYDKYASHDNHKDITVTLTPSASETLTAIKNGDTPLTENTDYTVSGANYTIKTSYLDTLATGTATLTFDMNEGTDPTLTITVADNTPIVTNTTIEQNTFETWTMPSEGTTKEFITAENGSYAWKGDVSIDAADNGSAQNKSIHTNSATADATFTMQFGDKKLTSSYTLEFDFFGEGTATGEGRFLIFNGKRPIQVNGSKFMVNGKEIAMNYQPGRWYHITIAVTYDAKVDDAAVGNSTKVTVTDLTGNQSANSTFAFKESMTLKKAQFGAVAVKDGSKLQGAYFDNIDIYEGEPNATRLTRPTVVPGSTPPAAGTYAVEAKSADAAKGSAAVTTEGTTFAANESVTIAATAKAGYKFTGWTAEGLTLTTEQQQANPLTITMPNNKVTVTAAFAAKTNATVTATATYDKYSESANNVATVLTLQPGDYALTAIKNGENTLTAGTDYTAEGNVYTIAKDYLNTLAQGTVTLTFVMDGGTNPTAAIQITNTAPNVATYRLQTTANATMGSVAVTPSGTAFEENVNVTVTATALKGYQFTNWTATGITLTEAQKTANPLTFAMPNSDVTLTANFIVDDTPDAMEQNTFEKWTMPSSGTTKEFVVAKNGSYAWKGDVSIDASNDGIVQNKSIHVNSAETESTFTMQFGGKKLTSSYTLEFDFFGEGTVTGEGRFLIFNGKRPIQVNGSKFMVNGKEIAMNYQPGRWYHITVAVTYNPASNDATVGNSTKVTVTDLTNNQSVNSTFMFKESMTLNNAQFGAVARNGSSLLGAYFDNIDIYEGAPDATRLTCPTIEPGVTPSDYYLDVKTASTTGINITKRIDTADEKALVVTALYDNSTAAPTLASVMTKEVTLKTGQTVTVAANEIVQKPAEGKYSVGYFVWKIAEDGTTLEVLASK